jgi:bacillopeptidase F
MDTGVDGQHPDLVSSWRGGTNSWYDPYSEFAQPHDGLGHGTQVMGVMVGGDVSGNNIGVAPGAHWISVKIFKDDATAFLSAIHSGFQWLLDPDGDPLTDDAPDIVNNSWGSISSQPTCDTEFHADVDALKLAGIEVVFAAGNGGPFDSSLYSPADYAEVVSVASVDEFMNVANTSSRGPSNCSTGYYPNLAAPGVGIYTSDLSPIGAQYATVEGTSFAAPHITGIIALLKTAVPTASYSDVRNSLHTTAFDLGSPGPDDVTGFGLVDAQLALLNLRCPTGTTDSDGDGWYDTCDNCIAHSNKSQLDSNGDGFGNMCDADLDNDGQVGFSDFGLFRSAFGTAGGDADFDGDGQVGFSDFGIFRSMFGSAPGPSGTAN